MQVNYTHKLADILKIINLFYYILKFVIEPYNHEDRMSLLNLLM